MSIESLSEQECITAIESAKHFHANVAHAPFICTAIHDGHRVRDEITDN